MHAQSRELHCHADHYCGTGRPGGLWPSHVHLIVSPSQATQVFSDWVSQTIRLYEGQNFIEVTYTVGPIPFQDGLGREVVSVWTTGLLSCIAFVLNADVLL